MHSCGSFVGQARFQFAGLHSLFLDRCICNLLFFELADTFQPACHVNCIYILPFLGFKDTPFANFASTSYVFDNVKMLLSKITHLQPTLSIPCRCSPVKSRILNLLFQFFADALHQNFASSISENPLSQISSLNILCCYSLHNLSQYITYKKIDIRNSSEYEMSVGDT